MLDNVKEIHIEPTSLCNAECPMCARNHFGGATKKDLNLDEWTTEDVRKIFYLYIKNL